MKIRNGFVSNSSSSCFVCNPGKYEGTKDYTVEEAREILAKILKSYNEIMDKSLLFEEVFGEIKIADEQDVKFLISWDEQWSEENVLGRLLITSECDNTIPFELYDIIGSKFSAWREHLG